MIESRIQRRDVLLGAAAAGLGLASGSSWADSNWPTKPVTVVVPFPAGGGTDAFARPLAAQFSKSTGKTLVIDNRGGAGGTLGASIASKAAPDGYALFMGAVHHAIAPSMYPKLDYDIEKDFIPLALLANVPQVVVVNPKTPSANFKQFLDYVKRNPAKLNYGSAGAGTSSSHTHAIGRSPSCRTSEAGPRKRKGLVPISVFSVIRANRRTCVPFTR